jgi:small-conductance mechanosensitive channel
MARPGTELTRELAAHEWARVVFALAATVGLAVLGNRVHATTLSKPDLKPVLWLVVVGVAMVGTITVHWGAFVLGKLVTRRSDVAAGAVTRFVTEALGYVVLLLTALAVLGVSLSRLLVATGVASVVLAIAAQQSLANIFASLVLLFARPFNVGDHIIIRSGTMGVLECQVRGIGLTYVTVEAESGIVKIPNAAMSAAAIGRVAPPTN